jgi:hypothetical protein
VRPPLGALVETAARLGVLDAALETLWKLVQGDCSGAAKSAENAAKKAAAKLAIEQMR